MTATPVCARFSAFRSVPARAVMALTLDVPSNEAPAAMAYLGWPVPGQAIHVAVARLDPGGASGVPISGTYESCRTVTGRSSLALTIEVPAERGHGALRALGVPTPESNIQVAVVLLTGEPPAPKPPKSAGAAAVQRAALRPKDPPFQRFILGPDYVRDDATTNEQRATARLREECGIDSRAELKSDPGKLEKFYKLERNYETWLQSGVDGSQR